MGNWPAGRVDNNQAWFRRLERRKKKDRANLEGGRGLLLLVLLDPGHQDHSDSFPFAAIDRSSRARFGSAE